MVNLTLVRTALRVGYDNLEHLFDGQAIAVISNIFVRPGQAFIICPPNHQVSEFITADMWFKSEACYALDGSEKIDEAVFLTAIDKDNLRKFIHEKNHVFLVKLRGYWLAKTASYSLEFNGQFAALPDPLSVDTSLPLISNKNFRQRESLSAYHYPEIEKLYWGVVKNFRSDPIASGLIREIQLFFDASSSHQVDFTRTDLDWIKNIVSLGYRSVEDDNQQKSNYQAGTDFENIVRKSLEFLGFSLEYQHKGGAGGLDVFCSKPYPLAVECKSGKKVKDTVVEQLEKIAKNHLAEKYNSCSKLIIMPGQPNSYLQKSATFSQVSIMSPNALQKLVEIQTKYPNSINLIELREFLKTGVVDQRINDYIEEKVLSKLRLYSRLLKVVAECAKEKQSSDIEAQNIFNACHDIDIFQNVDDKEIHCFLIELSSPFSGYLGRIKSSDYYWNDRFYYLRDLVVDDTL